MINVWYFDIIVLTTYILEGTILRCYKTKGGASGTGWCECDTVSSLKLNMGFDDPVYTQSHIHFIIHFIKTQEQATEKKQSK